MDNYKSYKGTNLFYNQIDILLLHNTQMLKNKNRAETYKIRFFKKIK